MDKLDIPFNITLLNLDNEQGWTKSVIPVSSQDIFEGMTRNFHPKGLYSTEIFGTPGTAIRYQRESYIDIKVHVLHPAIYKTLVSLKGLYADIMASRVYATWDNVANDFVACDSTQGSTGYSFFINYFRSIVHVQSESMQRKEKITLVEKYKEVALINKVYVMPAGYRDVEIDDTGRVSSDEINDLYGSLLSISNTISDTVVRNDVVAYDRQRMSLQTVFNEIYQKAINIIRGKNNLMMSKWAGRKVFDSTRNVLTAMDTSSSMLGSGDCPSMNDTMIGLLQFMKTARPIVLHHLKNSFLSKVFISHAAPAILTDTRTLKSTRINIKSATYDKWMSNEGLEKVINSYKEPSIRSNPIYVQGCYLGLVYRSPDGGYRFIHGIDEFPDTIKDGAKYCTPITYNDLFYDTCWRWANTIPLLVTRYPIATDRSTYPSMTYLMSTMRSEKRRWMNENFELTEQVAPRFPIDGSPTYDSLAPHAAREADLGADHDGDTGSAIAVMSVEGKQEVSKIMNSKSFYLGPDGRFVANCETSTIKYVLKNLTMGAQP